MYLIMRMSKVLIVIYSLKYSINQEISIFYFIINILKEILLSIDAVFVT